MAVLLLINIIMAVGLVLFFIIKKNKANKQLTYTRIYRLAQGKQSAKKSTTNSQEVL